MRKVIEFNFDKPSQDFKINGSTYTVYYDDESLDKYRQASKEYNDFQEEFTKIDLENADDEVRESANEKAKDKMAFLFETILGENTFEKLYEDSGKSLFNLLDLLVYLMGWLQEKVDVDAKRNAMKKKDYYVKKVPKEK